MKKNLLQIRREHLRNIDSWEKAVFEKMVKDNPNKFKKFIGFIEIRVYTTKDKIITEGFPINGTPTQQFRASLKRAGLLGKKLIEEKNGK